MKTQAVIKSTAMRKSGKSLFMMLASLLLALPFSVSGGLVAAQSANFVHIVVGNQHFGDEPGAFGGSGTYRGDDYDYTFDAPGVDPSKPANLMLMTYDV